MVMPLSSAEHKVLRKLVLLPDGPNAGRGSDMSGAYAEDARAVRRELCD